MLPRKPVAPGKTIGTRPGYMPMTQRVELDLATGGVPEWVPEMAIAYADFVNGQYYVDGAEAALDDVVYSVYDGSVFLDADGLGASSDTLRPALVSLIAAEVRVEIEFRPSSAQANRILLYAWQNDFAGDSTKHIKTVGLGPYTLAARQVNANGSQFAQASGEDAIAEDTTYTAIATFTTSLTRIQVEGGAAVSDATAVATSGIDRVDLGNWDSGGVFPGRIRKLTIYPA